MRIATAIQRSAYSFMAVSMVTVIAAYTIVMTQHSIGKPNSDGRTGKTFCDRSVSVRVLG